MNNESKKASLIMKKAFFVLSGIMFFIVGCYGKKETPGAMPTLIDGLKPSTSAPKESGNKAGPPPVGNPSLGMPGTGMPKAPGK